MKFSMAYDNKFIYRHKIDEVIYSPQQTNDPVLLEGEIKRISNKGRVRVILELTEKQWEDDDALQNLYIALETDEIYKQQVWFTFHTFMDKAKEQHQKYLKQYKFFYKDIFLDWEDLNAFIDDGVAAVRIGGQLGFELDKLAARLEDTKIEVRVLANATTTLNNATDSLVQFWIRPEDLDRYYSEYIDVCELVSNTNHNSNAVYKAYAIDKEWFGLYNELVYGLDSEIDGKYIIPRFGEARLNCGRRCLKDKRCQSCYVIANLGTAFETAKIYVKNHNSVPMAIG